jgi:hypothetical protein
MSDDSMSTIGCGYELIGMIKSYPEFKKLIDELKGILPNKEKLLDLAIADFSLNIVLQVAGVAISIILLVLAVFSGGVTAFQAAMAIATAVLAGISCWLI